MLSQCLSLCSLNSVIIKQASEHYNYRSYLKNLLTYGIDAIGSHLSNACWYLDAGDIKPCSDNTAETLTATANLGFITRWNKLSASKEDQLFGYLHSDLCNVTLYLVPGVRLKNRLT